MVKTRYSPKTFQSYWQTIGRLRVEDVSRWKVLPNYPSGSYLRGRMCRSCVEDTRPSTLLTPYQFLGKIYLCLSLTLLVLPLSVSTTIRSRFPLHRDSKKSVRKVNIKWKTKWWKGFPNLNVVLKWGSPPENVISKSSTINIFYLRTF